MKVAFNERRIQRGGTHFAGYPHQRGAGLGSVFNSLWRFALPFAKSAGKAVGRQALKTGVGVAQDVLNGENVGIAMEKGATTGARKLAKRTIKTVSKRVNQKGKGLGRQPKKPTKRTIGVYKQRKTIKRGKPNKRRKSTKRGKVTQIGQGRKRSIRKIIDSLA